MKIKVLIAAITLTFLSCIVSAHTTQECVDWAIAESANIGSKCSGDRSGQCANQEAKRIATAFQQCVKRSDDYQGASHP